MTAAWSRRSLLVGGAMALAGTAGIALTPHRRAGRGRPLAMLVPQRIGPWRARDDAAIVLPETAPGARLYDALLARTYAAAGLPTVMLVIAHGGAESAAWSVHRPETCYRGSGYAIADLRDATWPIGHGRRVPGRMMTATLGERVEQVGYWRRIADGFPVDDRAERMLTMPERLAGILPDGILVRMSTIGADRAAAVTAIGRFAAALVVACDGEGRRLLLGRSMA